MDSKPQPCPYKQDTLVAGMEGIVDGRAVDDCFYCALLYPESEDCPQCGKRLRYQPAQMAEGPSLIETWHVLLKQFQAETSPAHAQALLEHVHQHPEELKDKLGTASAPSIQTLREIFSVALSQSDDE